MDEWSSGLPDFPQLKDLSLEDKPLFDQLFKQFPPVISEFTFTNLFIWRQAYQIKVGRLQNFLCLLSDREENSFFFPPLGEGDVIKCYQSFLQYLEGKGIPPKIVRVPEVVVAQIDWKASGMKVELHRNQCDYVYLTQELIELKVALIMAPFVARSVQVVDPRPIASLGFLVFALVSFMRAEFSMQVDWMAIALPMFIQGAANVMFFLPLTALGLRGMSPERMPAATGLLNFLRYMGGAVGASLAITLWDDRAKLHRAQLAEHVVRGDPATESMLRALEARGYAPDQALAHIDHALEVEARMMSTVDLFWISGVLFLALALLVWLANAPRAAVKMTVQPGSHE